MKKVKLNYGAPLAEQLRPQKLGEIIGQKGLLGESGTITKMLDNGVLRSMILWGPPGVGKTTLARILAHEINGDILEFSGARAQIKELRDAVDLWCEKNNAQQNPQNDSLFINNNLPSTKKLVVFVDEIHRYNKAQQDYFLPWVEQGLFILIGATTENPSFEINNALLSRCAVMVLQALTPDELQDLISRALNHLQRESVFDKTAIRELIFQADGDGRKLLNDLEAVLLNNLNQQIINREELLKLLGQRLRKFDNGGDIFYEQISALHKAVRGSDVNAALYWFTRMIDGGCDPLYVARRMIRMASEDIGLADPQALTLTISATAAYERLGNPEGVLALAQTLIYLAALPKSNAVYTAYNSAKKFVSEDSSRPVPLHIRNAHTKLQKQLGAGEKYRYPHDEKHGYSAGENYWADGINPQSWYQPTDRGLEKKIQERLKFLQELDKKYNKS